MASLPQMFLFPDVSRSRYPAPHHGGRGERRLFAQRISQVGTKLPRHAARVRTGGAGALSLYAGFFLRAPAVAPVGAFAATAARIRAFSAFSLIFSPSWMSIARRTLPSRLELNSRDGSS